MKKEKYIERDGKRYKLIRKGKYSEISKPKSHKFLATKILSVFFVVFVAAPLGVTFGLFYDGTSKNVNAVTDENITDTLTKRLTRAINEFTETGGKVLTLNFDDETLDSVLMQVNHQFISETPAGDYIPKFYCTINENKYNFYADIRSGFFKTRAAICTTLEKVGKEDPELHFSIDSIKLGRLNIGTGFIGSIASNFVSQETINKVLTDAHFGATFDIPHMSLTYKRSQFAEDVGFWLNAATNGFSEMNLIFKMIGASANAITTDYTNGVKVGLDLSTFISKDTEVPEQVDLKLDLKTVNKNVETIINSSDFVPVKSTSEDSANLVTYIIHGYERVKDNKDITALINNEKNKVLIENLTKTSINDYKGKIIEKAGEDKRVDYIVDETVLNDFANPAGTIKTFSIRSTDLNNYLNNFPIIGTPVVLPTGSSNAYIALNNFCFDSSDGKLSAYIGADFNGITTINTKIPFKNVTFDSANGKLGIELDSEIKIGTIKVDVDTISQICSKFNVDKSSFKFENNKFEIAFPALKDVNCSCKINNGNITFTK